MRKVEIYRKGYKFSKQYPKDEVVTSFFMGASTHRYECYCDFEKKSQFCYKGEWYIIVYQRHSQNEVVIPCNVYARYTSLINKSEVFNADFILIDGKPLPQYSGRLKSAFAIC